MSWIDWLKRQPSSSEGTAQLRREPTNRHDKNAVGVFVNGMRIGHLARDDALRYEALLESFDGRDATAACRVRIQTGWRGSDSYAGAYSARLDLPPLDE